MEERLKEIKDWFEDLIDEETAELLAKYSLGGKVEFKIEEAKKIPGKVAFVGRVVKIEKREAKNGREFYRLFVKDDEGSAFVYLWDEAKELVYSGDLSEGDFVKFIAINKNGFFSVNSGDDVEILRKEKREFEGYLISSGENSEIFSGKLMKFKGEIKAEKGSYVRVRVEGEKIVDYEVLKENVFERIEKIVPGRYVNIKGFVIGLGEDLGRYAEITVSDKESSIDVVLWDEWRKIYFEVDIGDLIMIFNAYAKHEDVTKLHCGRSSYILLEKIY